MTKEEFKDKKKKFLETKKKQRKQLNAEFKKFIIRGNIVDLAVAVAVGSAFTAIVNSFVKDIIGGVVGWLLGDVDLSSLQITLGSGENPPAIKYGSFLQTIIYFLIVAIVMFLIVKLASKVVTKLNEIEDKKKKKEEQEEKKKEEEVIVAKKDETLIVLEEIRDMLKNKKEE